MTYTQSGPLILTPQRALLDASEQDVILTLAVPGSQLLGKVIAAIAIDVSNTASIAYVDPNGAQIHVFTDVGEAVWFYGATEDAWLKLSQEPSSVSASAFGDGSDGSATISTNIALTRAMFYENLTVNAGITLTTDRFPIYVKGTLTNNGNIVNNGVAGGIGGSGSPAGGAGGKAYYGFSGNAGGDGTPGPGDPGNTTAATLGGSGGAGGGTGPGAGGSAVAAPVVMPRARDLAAWGLYPTGASTTAVIAGGAGGGGASGDTQGAGGGGGGGVVAILAKILINNGTITANGGDGGDGDPGDPTGGGGGGGGGLILLVYGGKTGTGSTSAAGGAAGSGSNSEADGVAGSAGTLIELGP